jgi:hypothetical protein
VCVCVCVCVCARARARARVCVCVCVCKPRKWQQLTTGCGERQDSFSSYLHVELRNAQSAHTHIKLESTRNVNALRTERMTSACAQATQARVRGPHRLNDTIGLTHDPASPSQSSGRCAASRFSGYVNGVNVPVHSTRPRISVALTLPP